MSCISGLTSCKFGERASEKARSDRPFVLASRFRRCQTGRAFCHSACLRKRCKRINLILATTRQTRQTHETPVGDILSCLQLARGEQRWTCKQKVTRGRAVLSQNRIELMPDSRFHVVPNAFTPAPLEHSQVYAVTDRLSTNHIFDPDL